MPTAVRHLPNPGTVTVATGNSITGGTHTHGVTSSANPGAAASLLASDANGRLQLERIGLGVAPSYRLHATETYTGNAVGYTRTAWVERVVDPAADQVGDTRSEAILGYSYVPVGATHAVRHVYGFEGGAENYGTQAVQTLIGFSGWAANYGNAPVNEIVGTEGASWVDLNTVTELIGVKAHTYVPAAGTATSQYGVKVFSWIDGGTVPVQYAYYSDLDLDAVANWGLYIVNGDNWIGGQVAIGGTVAAGGQLHVDQSSPTGAIPVLVLDQADVDEPFIEFLGGTVYSGLAAQDEYIKVKDPNGNTRYLRFYA